MGTTPKVDKKPKYNNNKAFEWVDSQWEKFMTEQKEHKAMIKQLQKDLGTCTENFQKQREEDEEAKLRIDQLRNLHRNVFMRHVHFELGKIWEKRDT